MFTSQGNTYTIAIVIPLWHLIVNMFVLAVIFAWCLCAVSCDVKLSARPRCEPNTTFVLDYNATYSERTCDGLYLTKSGPGCYCKGDYAINRVTSQCILSSDCPRYQCNAHEVCPANEVYIVCTSPCETTCKRPEPSPSCATAGCRIGCACRDMEVRDDETGKCIPQSECLGCTKRNAVYSTCPLLCPPTCQHPVPLTMCIQSCRPGCYCKEGFLLDEVSLQCVPKNKCPNKVRVH